MAGSVSTAPDDAAGRLLNEGAGPSAGRPFVWPNAAGEGHRRGRRQSSAGWVAVGCITGSQT